MAGLGIAEIQLDMFSDHELKKLAIAPVKPMGPVFACAVFKELNAMEQAVLDTLVAVIKTSAAHR